MAISDYNESASLNTSIGGKDISPNCPRENIDDAIRQIMADVAVLPTATGAGLVGFRQTGAGAVTRTLEDKGREIVSLKDFGAVGDGITDDTTAINTFLAVVAAGVRGFIPAATYKFTSALTPITGQHIEVYGEGENSILLYTGASTTPGDLMTIGDGVSTYYGTTLSDFVIGSTTTLTAGKAVRLRKCQFNYLDIVVNGPTGHSGKLYIGLSIEGGAYTYLGVSRFYCISKGVLASDTIELHCQHAWVGGNAGTGVGVHLAGGVSAFYTENIQQLFNNYGLLVDNSASAAANQQLFCKTGEFDSNTTAAIYLNDATAATISKFVEIGCWLASTSAGAGLTIGSWAGGRIDLTTARILNNSASGISSSDTTVTLNVSEAATISDNGAYGIDATGSWTVTCTAKMFSNTSGNFSVNVKPRGLSARYDPEASWGVDLTTNGATSLGTGGSIILPAGSGLVEVMNDSTGDGALFHCYAGTVTKVTGAATMVSGAPGASQIGFQFSGGSYRVTNGYATTQNIYVGSIRCRPTS